MPASLGRPPLLPLVKLLSMPEPLLPLPLLPPLLLDPSPGIVPSNG
jgi:hypothetical protein